MFAFFYFINDKYEKVLQVNDKKEEKIELNEIKIISEENENLLDKKKNNVNNVIDIRVIYKKLLNYIS